MTQRVKWPSRVPGTFRSSVNGAMSCYCKDRTDRPTEAPAVFSFSIFKVRTWLCFHRSKVNKHSVSGCAPHVQFLCFREYI